MHTTRTHPYIWTTWLPRLLTGDNSCEWAAHFKAWNQGWEARFPPKDRVTWYNDRFRLLRARRDQLQRDGYDVYMEGQNTYRIHSDQAILSGRPDLMAIRDNEVLVSDIRTGQEQPWHPVQVMIHLYAIRRTVPQYEHANITGEVVYPDRIVPIRAGSPDPQFVLNLQQLISRIAAQSPAKRVPSAQECSVCWIGPDNCPDRIDSDVALREVTTAGS